MVLSGRLEIVQRLEDSFPFCHLLGVFLQLKMKELDPESIQLISRRLNATGCSDIQ
jgi:hypothetical protein